jgi:dienelactone hydrolase
LLLACVAGAASSAIDERVVIDSDGWVLVGEWRAPASETPVPAALLLHRAAGSREEYADLASALASRGVASLRLDLRAHGESDGLGRFEEPYAETRPLLEGTPRDVNAALSWMKARPGVAGERVAVVGASYSGEAIGEALRAGGDRAAAYVLLSPGSLSTESIAAVDSSGASWLFIRTSEEGEVSLPFIDAVFDELAAKSRSAEVRVVPGVGHATGIFDEHPFMIEEIADWLAERLAVVGVRTEAPPSNLAAVARLTRSACWSSE